MFPTNAWIAGFLLLVSVGSANAQHHAHTHGVVKLDVTIEQGTVTIELEAPLESLIGFERAPRTDIEKQRAREVVERLRSAASLFLVDPAAQCQLQHVELESAVLGLGPEASAAGNPPVSARGLAQAEHADLGGRFVFRCEQAASARFVDVGLFATFSRVRTVTAQVAAPAGQFKRTLRKDSARLSWGR